MGLFDALKKKPEEQKPIQEKTEEPKAMALQKENTGKFNEACALCGKNQTDVKWMGQYWHVKCKRQGKKYAKKMI